MNYPCLFFYSIRSEKISISYQTLKILSIEFFAVFNKTQRHPWFSFAITSPRLFVVPLKCFCSAFHNHDNLIKFQCVQIWHISIRFLETHSQVIVIPEVEIIIHFRITILSSKRDRYSTSCGIRESFKNLLGKIEISKLTTVLPNFSVRQKCT